jgi:hypothetical protein
MDETASRSAEIIVRLMEVLQHYLVEVAAQRTALDTLREFWPEEDDLNWHLLVDGNKARIAPDVAVYIALIRDNLLEELSQGPSAPPLDLEAVVRRLIESVQDIDRPE